VEEEQEQGGQGRGAGWLAVISSESVAVDHAEPVLMTLIRLLGLLFLTASRQPLTSAVLHLPTRPPSPSHVT